MSQRDAYRIAHSQSFREAVRNRVEMRRRQQTGSLTGAGPRHRNMISSHDVKRLTDEILAEAEMWSLLAVGEGL